MEKNGEPCFKSSDVVAEIDENIQYLTIIGNEITLFSNESYLYFDKNSDIAKYKAMEKFKYEKYEEKNLIYYRNKNYVLTIRGDKISFEKERSEKDNQLFEFLDIYNEN